MHRARKSNSSCVERKRSSRPVSTSSIRPQKHCCLVFVSDPSCRTNAPRITTSQYRFDSTQCVKGAFNFCEIHHWRAASGVFTTFYERLHLVDKAPMLTALFLRERCEPQVKEERS